jgi:hypothetical protein
MFGNGLNLTDIRMYRRHDRTIFGGDPEPEWLRRTAEQRRVLAEAKAAMPRPLTRARRLPTRLALFRRAAE